MDWKDFTTAATELAVQWLVAVAALFLICYEAWERGHVFCLRSNLIFVLVIKSRRGMGEVYVSQFAMKLAAFLSASLCPAAAWRCYQLAHDVTSIRGSIHLTTEGFSTYNGIA